MRLSLSVLRRVPLRRPVLAALDVRICRQCGGLTIDMISDSTFQPKWRRVKEGGDKCSERSYACVRRIPHDHGGVAVLDYASGFN